MRGLLHPHLSQVEDFGFTADGRAYYTSRLIDGPNLAQVATAGDWPTLTQVLIDILAALGLLHSLELRHGDIKPQNVLVEAGRGMLIDLSCAAPFGQVSTLSGTPRYFAPELRPGSFADGRSDLFALGVLIDDLEEIAGDAPDPVQRLRRRIAKPLDQRPATVEEALEALGVAQASIVVHAEPPRLVGRERIVQHFGELLQSLERAAAARRRLVISGPRDSGRTRLLQELKWIAQQRIQGTFMEGRRHGQLARVCELENVDPLGGDLGQEPRVWLIDDVDALDGRDAALFGELLALCERPDAPLLLVASTASRQMDADMFIEALSLKETREFVGPLREHLSKVLHETCEGLPGKLVRTLRRLGNGATRAAVERASQSVDELGELSPSRSAALKRLAGGPRALLARIVVAEAMPIDNADPSASAALIDDGWVQRQGDHLTINDAERGALWAALRPGELRAAHRVTAQNASDSALVVRHLALASDAESALLALSAARVTPGSRWRLAASALAAIAPSEAARIYETCGAPEEAIKLLGDADSVDDLVRLAACLLRMNRTVDALAALERAEHRAKSTEERARVADQRSKALIRGGQYSEALDEASSHLTDTLGSSIRASLEENIGVAASYHGDHQKAATHLQRAAELHSGRDPRSKFRVLSYQAIDAYRRAAWDEAAAQYRAALELAEEQGLDDQVALAALNAGTVYHQRGDWGLALELYTRGQRAALALEQRAPLSFDLAKLFADIGAFDRAADAVERAEQASERGGYAFLVGACWAVRGDIALGREQPDEALKHYEKARQLFDEQRASREVTELDISRAAAFLAKESVQQAQGILDEVEVSATGDLKVNVVFLQAKAALREGRTSEAKSLVESAQPELAPQRATRDALLSEIWKRLGAQSNAARCARQSREVWERVAAGLDPALRDLFWSHPDRLVLKQPQELAQGSGSSERESKLARLVAINRTMSSTLDTDDVLRMAMDAAVELVGAERGFLVLRRPDGSLHVPVARNIDREHVGRSHTKFSKSIADQVVETGESIVTIDARNDSRFASNESVHAMKLRSVLAVPIPSPDGVQGALYLDNRFQHGRFEEDDASLLAAFADQLSIALRNAALMRELRERSAELEAQRKQIEELSRGQAATIDALTAQVEAQRERFERRYDYGNLVGRSPAMRQVLDTLDRVIDSPLSVLVTGESGTGKELIARAVHAQSPRSEGPFVAVNCGALPDTLLESELFGHMRGAFTGADRDRKGLMESAHGGTLFLDELGEMSIAMQVKLLRVLETRQIRPVGGRELTDVDFRLVCATNRDLAAEVEADRFRSDLYYRVGVVQVRLPPLRERLDDLPELTAQLLGRVGDELGAAPEITADAMRLLLAYSWPGNVRQLFNVLRSAAVFADGPIRPEHLSLPDATQSMDPERAERYRIESALRRNGGRAAPAAKELGISRATMYRWMKEHGIPPRRRAR